jgi:proliferating cell nuclear antigen
MIKTKNISLFKKSLEVITPLIQETNIRFKDTGIYIKAIDKTQILLVDFNISKKAFDSYSVEPSLIGMNIQELLQMISRSFDKDSLILDLKEQYLDILLKGKIERNFNLPYMDLSEQDFNLPEIKYDVSFNLGAGLLKEIIKDVTLVATTLIFKIENNKFIIEATGERGKIRTNVLDVKTKSKGNIVAKYSLAFLKNIVKSMDNEAILNIKFSEDAPLFIDYKIDDNTDIKFYLSSMLI